MSKRFIVTLITLLVIGLAAGLAIFFAKGYTFSPQEKRIIGTGILTVSSEPDSASVYLDGHLTTATNATVGSLSPKTYSVRLTKEGFIPWEKSVTVREGLVTELKVTLFPAIPTIYPLTFTSVTKPLLSPDGSRLLFVVPSGKKAGVWVWGMGKNQPLSFARNSEPHQISTNSTVDFSTAQFRWSPDSTEILAGIGNTSYLLSDGKLNSEPRDITAILEATLKSWDEDIETKDHARIEAIVDIRLKKIASDAAVLRWSPDETKFMARKEPLPDVSSRQDKSAVVSDMKVYDIGAAKSGQGPVLAGEGGGLPVKEYSLPSAKDHLWLPDSRHIILVEDDTISLTDYDGTNKAVIFAGSFLDGFVFPWPDSSRLVIISSLPTPTASEPNFYGINLK